MEEKYNFELNFKENFPGGTKQNKADLQAIYLVCKEIAFSQNRLNMVLYSIGNLLPRICFRLI